VSNNAKGRARRAGPWLAMGPAVLLGASCAAPSPASPASVQPDLTGLWLAEEGNCGDRSVKTTVRVWKSGKNFVAVIEEHQCPPVDWRGAKVWAGRYTGPGVLAVTDYSYSFSDRGQVTDTRTESEVLEVVDGDHIRVRGGGEYQRIR
jgi:hypothetical protein